MAGFDFDQKVLENFPVVIARHDGILVRPTKAGIRQILAAKGVYREVSTLWVERIKLHGPCRLPYGDLDASVEFLLSAPPVQLWRDFVENSRLALPNECAGLMVFNTDSSEWRLEMRVPLFSSRAQIDYQEPLLSEEDLAIVDIHSHGYYGAFFSDRDNQDDAGGIKISVVVGKVNQPIPEFKMRLVALDEFLPIQLQDGKFTP